MRIRHVVGQRAMRGQVEQRLLTLRLILRHLNARRDSKTKIETSSICASHISPLNIELPLIALDPSPTLRLANLLHMQTH